MTTLYIESTIRNRLLKKTKWKNSSIKFDKKSINLQNLHKFCSEKEEKNFSKMF